MPIYLTSEFTTMVRILKIAKSLTSVKAKGCYCFLTGWNYPVVTEF